jgi:hypothetical protein
MFVFTATSLYASDPEHSRTWRADLIPWSEHNTESFAGLHNEGKRIVLLMDESSAIADKVWETSEGALTDSNTQIIWLALGNPTRNTGRFRECFRKYKHRWDHDQIDSRTVEGVNLQQVQKWVEDYGEDSDFVKVRVRGMFPAASAKQFISETDVDAAYGKKLHPHAVDHAPKILTVDPAWTGDDEFVVGLRQGLAFKVLRVIARNDNDVEMANMIARTGGRRGRGCSVRGFRLRHGHRVGRSHARSRLDPRQLRRKVRRFGLPQQARGDVERDADVAEGKAAQFPPIHRCTPS